MKRQFKDFFWIPTILLLALIVWIFIDQPVRIDNANTQGAVLDLSDWDTKTLVKLNGEWEYFEDRKISDIDPDTTGSLVFVPHTFPQNPDYEGNPYGVATYRLTLQGLVPEEIYRIQIMNEVSAYRLVVNEHEVLKAGVVSGNPSTHQPEMKEKTGSFEPDENGQAVILLEVSNFSYNYGGQWKELIFGNDVNLMAYSNHQSSIEILLFGIILVLGLYFISLYGITTDFKPLLYFALICLLSAFRTLFTNHKLFYDLIYPISWDLGTRIEFLLGYLLLPAYGLFFVSLNYLPILRVLKPFFRLFGLAAILLMIFAPNEVYAPLLVPYISLCVIFILLFILTILTGVFKRKDGSVLVLIGTLGLVPTILLDFYSNLTYDLLPLGILIMLVFFSIMVIRNLFRIKQNKDDLEEAILIDPLTGLKNRFYLNRLMDTGLGFPDNRKQFILFFDLNRFKQINDTYGHNVGDQILIESAKRIQASLLRDSDILCRYGGDEFIAFIRTPSVEDAERIIQRIQTAFETPFRLEAGDLSVGVSIGLSEFHPGDDLEKAIRQSDEHMYRVKKATSEI